MTLNIQTVHFDADERLIEHVTRKSGRIAHLHEGVLRVDVFLKLDNVVHQIKDKVAEIRVSVPRRQFFVKQTSKSFEESFDGALDSIIERIRRSKERMTA